MINLDQRERDKFLAWCLQEAKSAEQMVEASKALDARTAEAIARTYRAEATALRLVGGYLASIESMTVGGRT